MFQKGVFWDSTQNMHKFALRYSINALPGVAFVLCVQLVVFPMQITSNVSDQIADGV